MLGYLTTEKLEGIQKEGGKMHECMKVNFSGEFLIYIRGRGGGGGGGRRAPPVEMDMNTVTTLKENSILGKFFTI
jgi:hypothetical protein